MSKENLLAIQNPYISEGPSSNNTIYKELEKLIVSEIQANVIPLRIIFIKDNLSIA